MLQMTSASAYYTGRATSGCVVVQWAEDWESCGRVVELVYSL